MKKIIPLQESKRVEIARCFIDAPNPMYTITKQFNVTNLKEFSDKKGYSFTMLLNFCIAKTAALIPEFLTMVEDDHFVQYDHFSVRITFLKEDNTACYCDVPESLSLEDFNACYMEKRTNGVHSLDENSAHIDTSALPYLEFDSVGAGYSKVFRAPYMAWGKYRQEKDQWILPISFKFDHTQMDGLHAALFLNGFQKAINQIR